MKEVTGFEGAFSMLPPLSCAHSGKLTEKGELVVSLPKNAQSAQIFSTIQFELNTRVLILVTTIKIADGSRMNAEVVTCVPRTPCKCIIF